MTMIENDKICFQGDVCFRRVKSIPSKFKREARKGPLIVAHSETGHHHLIEDAGVVRFDGGDPLKCYLLLESVDHCDVVHKRPHDTHETIRLGGGSGAVYEVIRQQEWSPAGWRRVQD
jgi:hypothetical protein